MGSFMSGWITMDQEQDQDQSGTAQKKEKRHEVSFSFVLILQMIDTFPSYCPLGSVYCHLGFPLAFPAP